jgi:uncharacterized membrane protein
MNDDAALIIVLVLLVLFVVTLALPIAALVVSIRTRKKLNDAMARRDGRPLAPAPSLEIFTGVVQQLTIRVARLEAAISGQPPPPPATYPESATPPHVEPGTIPPRVATPPFAPAPPPAVPTTTAAPPTEAQPFRPRPLQAAEWESVIGRRWMAWAAIGLIVFATAFFFKYAFDNRWIGELGRVAIGVTAGLTLTGLAFRYHKRGWRVFSQILTGGGVVLLYLSAYASFGYYQLTTQKAAFVYMAILIAEAAGLALLYNAPSIAVMALIGGFLVPVLLHSERDQYGSLFTYIVGLDAGALGLLKQWPGLSSLAFGGTHLLFWVWYVENYHPRKLTAVMIFHVAVFLFFLLSYLGRRFFGNQSVAFADPEPVTNNPIKFSSSLEDYALLLVNPFVFFVTGYYFLNPNHHDWMGVFAIGLALLYAGAAKLLLDRAKASKTELLLMIGVALTFLTLAIPIQLKANWITMAWAIEALLILWVALEMNSLRLRVVAYALFALGLLKLVFVDTPYGLRPTFTPVLNKYFLSSLFVVGCLFAGALVNQKLRERKQIPARAVTLVMVIVAIVILWWVTSIETHTFFVARAERLRDVEDIRHQRWLGQMALSVLWSIYAAALAAIGFVRRTAAIRWAALSLFALTVLKVMVIDMAVLKQLYRIIAFLVLGLLLLVVAWGYHKAFQSKEST